MTRFFLGFVAISVEYVECNEKGCQRKDNFMETCDICNGTITGEELDIDGYYYHQECYDSYWFSNEVYEERIISCP